MLHVTRFRSATAALAVLLGSGPAAAETPSRQAVVASKDYMVGGFTRLWLGDDYRELWATPVSVEVLDLGREAGGLKPVRRVGGQQTKGLAFAGADRRSYTFRGLDKDASHLLDTLDPELKNTVVAKVLDLLMAAQHPASDLIARGILDAVGIPCPDWRLVVLPDDPALGEFQKDFAGAIGMFGVYPEPARGGAPGFIGATEIVDHAELYKRLQAGDGDAVDAQALLKARLVDIFMGDWDRHRKQWRWAKLPGNPLWVPIPEDRDQAFARYEGLALDMARGTDPRFQNFGPKYAGVGGLTFNGSEQDRQLLVPFSREDFGAAAKALQAQLTDEVIEKAVRMMPPEWYALDGVRLNADLRSRRDLLPEVAAKYHEHLAVRVDVRLTNKSERIEATRRPNGDTEVTVHVLGADGQPGPPTFHRVFDAKETAEIRFYTYDGNDTLKVTGAHEGPKLRLMGGNGDDVLDATGSGNAKLSDSKGQNRALDAADDSRPYEPPPPPKNAPWIPPRDWTRESYRSPWVSYGGDLGVFLGYGIETQKFGFRKTPFANSHRVRAGYAFGQQNGKVDYLGVFHRENRSSFVGLYAYASGVEVLRFYGFGNDTEASADDQDFYKVNARQFLLYPTFAVPLGKRGVFTIGPALKYTESNETKDQYINQAQPYGVGKFGAIGLHSVLSYDRRDSRVFPRHGSFAAVRGTYFPKLWDVESDFGQVNGNLNGYFSAGRVLTLALRAGGKKVFGTYPYMEAASIGEGGLGSGALSEPEDTVRGYRARRYLGDASAWANAGLRLKVSHMTLILPGAWGINGFGDVGRVWLKGESSDTWHPGVGGGIWLSLLNDRMAFSTGISHSSQDDIWYFNGGFSY
jgi:hypothetical protein